MFNERNNGAWLCCNRELNILLRICYGRLDFGLQMILDFIFRMNYIFNLSIRLAPLTKLC